MAIVNRALGLTEKSNKVNHYKDVPKGAWYKDEVAKALAAGYITGTSENMMSPLNTITNEQVFAIISRLSKEEGEIDLGAVKDGEKISGWAKQGIKKAIAGGYVTGYKGNVQPKKNATKAQIAVLISRYKKNERVIAFPGTYSFKKAEEITVLSNGVTIKDSEIDGDVKVGKEVAEIIIENSKIKGKVETENKNTKVLDKGKTEDTVLKDGEYEGKAVGYSGDIVVKIKIAGGKLVDVKVIKQTETPAYYAMLDGFVDKIIKKGSPEGIDVVSGATVSSNAILNAVRDALSQATGETKKPGEKIAEENTPGLIHRPNGSKPKKNDYNKNKLKDGTYEGKARGFRGFINVSVEVEGKKIKSIKTKHKEDKGYYSDVAEATMIDRVIKANSTNVDTIAGATVSSNGFLAAVENALTGKQEEPLKSLLGKDEAAVRERSDQAIKEFTLEGELENGEFHGAKSGFHDGSTIDSDVNIANGKVTAIEILPYTDGTGDTESYRPMAIKILPFLKNDNVRKNIAIMSTHYKYTMELYKINDPEKLYQRGKELLGAKCAEECKNVPSTFHSRFTALSGAVKKYLVHEYTEGDVRDMMDAVAGATLSAGGMARSVGHAMENSAHDKKTGNKVKSIKVSKPTNKKIFANKKDPVKLDDLKITLNNRDGSSAEVGINEFEANNLMLYEKATNTPITNGMILKDFKWTITIIVKHTLSNRTDEFSITISDNYSENWIKSMEYKVEGKDWVKVENPNMREATSFAPYDVNNIDYKQVVELTKENANEYLGKKVKLRVETLKPEKEGEPDSKYIMLDGEHTIEKGKLLRFNTPQAPQKLNGNLWFFYGITFNAPEPDVEDVAFDFENISEIKIKESGMGTYKFLKAGQKISWNDVKIELKDIDDVVLELTREQLLDVVGAVEGSKVVFEPDEGTLIDKSLNDKSYKVTITVNDNEVSGTGTKKFLVM